jgi:hypothetical protein
MMNNLIWWWKNDWFKIILALPLDYWLIKSDWKLLFVLDRLLIYGLAMKLFSKIKCGYFVNSKFFLYLQMSLFVVYNMTTTEVQAVYDNTSEELLDMFEKFCDFFRNTNFRSDGQGNQVTWLAPSQMSSF